MKAPPLKTKSLRCREHARCNCEVHCFAGYAEVRSCAMSTNPGCSGMRRLLTGGRQTGGWITPRTSGLSAAEDCGTTAGRSQCNCTRLISNQAIGFEASTLTQTLLLGGTKLCAACPACRRLTGHSKADFCDFLEGNQTLVSKGSLDSNNTSVRDRYSGHTFLGGFSKCDNASLWIFVPVGDRLLDCLSRVNREELELAKIVNPLIMVPMISKVEGSTGRQPEPNVALLKFYGGIDDDQMLRLQVDLPNRRDQICLYSQNCVTVGGDPRPAF